MAEITAGQVKELREKTGAGMMDCKTALTETGGDMEAAVDWLRAKGLSKAAKKSSRIAAEGLVAAAVEGQRGALVEVNAETDFVARNDKFQAMVAEVARLALSSEGSIEKLKGQPFPGSRNDVAQQVAELVATIGENMTVRRTALLKVAQGAVGQYVHNQAAPGMGKIASLVALESTGNADELMSLARLLAMHVAASNPVALDLQTVPVQTLEREKAILAEKNAGKPANVMEKIIQSGLKSYAKEFCLLEQAYVHDAAKSVSQVLKETEGKLGAPVRLTGFARFQLGEGIEKQADDFAAEVAKAAATS
ncbi:MAG TPA: translation elongation factor Ts [Aestuariivirgaceae bacterium]|nr:translation elongation factor Ts [Aestuariivirgaceae bacterium]